MDCARRRARPAAFLAPLQSGPASDGSLRLGVLYRLLGPGRVPALLQGPAAHFPRRSLDGPLGDLGANPFPAICNSHFLRFAQVCRIRSITSGGCAAVVMSERS